MDLQDFANAKHFLLTMASLSLLFLGKIVHLITVVPEEISGVIGIGIHIVLCNKYP